VTGAVLTREGDALHLNLSACRGSDFHDAKTKIKEVPGRRWNPETKTWIVPADAQGADRILKTIHPECSEELTNWVKAEMMQHEESLTSLLPEDAEGELLIPWAKQRMQWQPEQVNEEKFNGALPYQRAAIEQMAEHSRAILADDMGLGKTFEAISAIEEWKLRNPDEEDGPKLVVCPSSVKGTWKRELERWLPPGVKVHVIKGTYTKTKTMTADQRRQQAILDGINENAWIIVNWEQLRVVKQKVKTRNGGLKTVKIMKEPLFEQTDWYAVIGDEAHRAKNPNAQQTRGLWRCTGNVMYALTGTPIMNAPGEIWSLLRWLWPNEFHELGMRKNAVAHQTFCDEYEEYYEDFRNKRVVTGVKNPDALRFVLRDKLIRRTADILGLKGRKRIFYEIDLNPTQQKMYDEAETAMWLAITEEIVAGNKDAIDFARAALQGESVANLIRIPNGAARMVRQRQIIENCKLLGGPDDSASMDDFEEKFEDSGKAQWIVFCAFKDSCDILAERLRKKFGAEVGVYTGDVKPASRTAMEDAFQRGELDVMVGTIDAMREGITLTNSHLQHWISRAFVPAHNEQGESREDRLGQQHLVLVYIPQPQDTVSTDKVHPINKLKESIVRTVLPQVHIKEATS
jgi:SNF2 family DNA or RNA helicase